MALANESGDLSLSLGMRTGFKSIDGVGFITASLSQVPKGDSVWLLMGYSTAPEGGCLCVLHASIHVHVCILLPCVHRCVCDVYT